MKVIISPILLALILPATSCSSTALTEVNSVHTPSSSATITRTATSTLSPGMGTLLARWATFGPPTRLPPASSRHRSDPGNVMQDANATLNAQATLAARRANPASSFTATPTPDAMVFGMFPDPDLWLAHPVLDHPFRMGVLAHRTIDDCYATVMSPAPLNVDESYPIEFAVDPDRHTLVSEQFTLGELKAEKFKTTVPGFVVYMLDVPPLYGCVSLYLEVHHPIDPAVCLAAIEDLLATYHEMPWLAPGLCG